MYARDFWPHKDMVMFDLMASGLVKLLKLYIEQKQQRAFDYKSCVVIEVLGKTLSVDTQRSVVYAWGVSQAMWATKIRTKATVLL